MLSGSCRGKQSATRQVGKSISVTRIGLVTHPRPISAITGIEVFITVALNIAGRSYYSFFLVDLSRCLSGVGGAGSGWRGETETGFMLSLACLQHSARPGYREADYALTSDGRPAQGTSESAKFEWWPWASCMIIWKNAPLLG